MTDWLFEHRPALQFLSLFGALLCVALAEAFFECRPRVHSAARRWFANVGLLFGNRAFAAWAMPIGMLGVASWSEAQGFGLLHWLDAPLGLEALLGVLALDLASYASHRLHHAVPALWRLHRVHHSDPELDFSTAHRAHPLALLTGGGIQLAAGALFGVSALAVLVTALLRGVFDALVHGNLRFAPALDRALRLALVTPSHHALHHSANRASTDSNFGALTTFWDRAFATWREVPEANWRAGLDEFRSARDGDLDRMLLQPLRSVVR